VSSSIGGWSSREICRTDWRAASVIDDCGRLARGDGPPGHRQLHLDRRQRLADFVVQLAGDHAALVLLRPHEARRQAMQLRRVVGVGGELGPQLAVQPAHVARHEHPDGQAQQERRAAGHEEAVARASVQAGFPPPLLLEVRPVQRLHVRDDADDALAAGDDAVVEDLAELGHAPGRRQRHNRQHRGPVVVDLARQLGDRTGASKRFATALQLLEAGRAHLLVAAKLREVVLRPDGALGVEQGVAPVDRAQQHARPEIGQRLL
jgi:hypothetical protein